MRNVSQYAFANRKRRGVPARLMANSAVALVMRRNLVTSNVARHARTVFSHIHLRNTVGALEETDRRNPPALAGGLFVLQY